MMLHEALAPLAARAWAMFEGAVGALNGAVVRPSMPILYFGDSQAYAESALKVVTVGLNPSRREFPRDEPWRRFPDAASADATIPLDTYLGSLDSYFRSSPYGGWFDPGFEPILLGMGSSYYGGRNTALHTDICSPVATDPTWSRLGARSRAVAGKNGADLWVDLVSVLEPDVILVSVGRKHLQNLTLLPFQTWPVVFTIERKNPFPVRATEADVGGHSTLIVFGSAAQLPFGTVSAHDKARIGAAMRRLVRGA